MKIDILASGSHGNCIALTNNEITLLIDAGVAKTKIEKRLMEVGINPADVAAILITHAHGDHVKGLPIANKYSIPVYAGADEWTDIKGVESGLKRDAKDIQIEGFHIDVFAVHHDARQPVGYAVTTNRGRDNERKTSICLDTGKVDEQMLQKMAGSDTYIIEANHDPMMVEASSYPTSVQIRVLSDIGHLSNEQTANALAKLLTGRGEQVYLVHLSSKNNMPSLAKVVVMNVLYRQRKLEEGINYHLEVIS